LELFVFISNTLRISGRGREEEKDIEWGKRIEVAYVNIA
jgi:hypothetical protein